MGGLVRLILRRDQRLLPVWVLYSALIPLVFVPTVNGLFPTAAGRQGYAATSGSNAGFVALYGRLSGSGLGELVAWRSGFVPVVVGLLSILTVVRHTRTEEEAGRRELLGSTVVGRHAGLSAALAVTVGADLALGTVLAVGMIVLGLPTAGSWAFGAQFAAAGVVFAAIAGVAAQLTGGAGGARGIAVTVLGVAYVFRMVGDVSSLSARPLSWLSLLSPIGWIQRIRPYDGDHWWPVVLAVGVAVVLAVSAVALSARRDVGAGLLPPRLGRASAAPGLRSPLGLAWRLHRGLLAAWLAGFAALGVVLGYLAAGVGSLVGGSSQMRDIVGRLGGGGALVDSYLAAVLGLLGLIAAAYAVQATLRMRDEETGGRAEPVLGTAVGRLRWVGSHLVFSLLGPAAALVVAGLAMGLAHGLNTGDVGRELPRMLTGALVQLPAVWVLGAVAVALVGLWPRFAAASWGALALCLLVGLVGAAVRFDRWILDISPFTHLPRLPGGAVSAMPLVWLTAVAVAVAVAGLAGFRRRDLPSA